jgi:formate dehydrogenase major subunit
MSDTIVFKLDGKDVTAGHGETIWDVAKREGTKIPHLCHVDLPGYRVDGNCRACMVEVKGERVLTASCIRKPTKGMEVQTQSQRSVKSREMVFELLASNMRPREQGPDNQAPFWEWASSMGIAGSDRYASKFAGGHERGHAEAALDLSNPAIAVNLDACISCGACVRACREVQVNDVIGMGLRGSHAVPVFDIHDPMGLSTCVTCGECVQACPTGALYEKSLMDKTATKRAVQKFDKVVNTLCPFCGVGCQTAVAVKDNRIVQVDGRDGYANENRLCVKGRFGYDYVASPERLTKPLIRRDGAPKSDADVNKSYADRLSVFREATWEEALTRSAAGLKKILDERGGKALSGFGSAKGSNEEAYLFQKLVRTGFETNNVDHCTRLCHASSVAALMEGIGSGAVSAPFNSAMDADCIIVIGARPTVNHPVAATFFKQAAKRGAKLIVIDPRGQDLMRHATYGLKFRPGSDVALLNSFLHTIIGEKLYDESYIREHVSGFESLKAKVKDFSPEAMAEVVCIEASELRDVARNYDTTKASIIIWRMGNTQHTQVTDNARC